jgi:hypothetical protein
MRPLLCIPLAFTVAFTTCCAFGTQVLAQTGPLPSWNNGPTKQAIMTFVEKVTDQDGRDYVAPEDRVAVFDNDGTLWNEKPLYVHFFAVFDHMKQQMAADPSLKSREPYKSIANKDRDYFVSLYEAAAYDTLLGQLIGVPFGGMTTEAFAEWGRTWVKKWKHPKYKVGVEGLTYQPMLELLRYLKANDFEVHIFTADEAAFLRLVSEELYGLPASHVHGSSVRTEYVVDKGKAHLVRTYQARYLDNWAGKPRLIMQEIGKRPILAAGNSNGDFHMLQHTALTGGIALLVHHTDGEREDEYDSHTDKVMPLAQTEGWTVIDMKNDWQCVFASQCK